MVHILPLYLIQNWKPTVLFEHIDLSPIPHVGTVKVPWHTLPSTSGSVHFVQLTFH